MDNGVSPKMAMWVNVAFLVLTGAAAGTVNFAGVSDATAGLIKSWSANGAFLISTVNTVLHMYSAPAAGPAVK